MSSVVKRELNTLPNDKISDWFKIKVLADDEIYITKTRAQNCRKIRPSHH